MTPIGRTLLVSLVVVLLWACSPTNARIATHPETSLVQAMREIFVISTELFPQGFDVWLKEPIREIESRYILPSELSAHLSGADVLLIENAEFRELLSKVLVEHRAGFFGLSEEAHHWIAHDPQTREIRHRSIANGSAKFSLMLLWQWRFDENLRFYIDNRGKLEKQRLSWSNAELRAGLVDLEGIIFFENPQWSEMEGRECAERTWGRLYNPEEEISVDAAAMRDSEIDCAKILNFSNRKPTSKEEFVKTIDEQSDVRRLVRSRLFTDTPDRNGNVTIPPVALEWLRREFRYFYRAVRHKFPAVHAQTLNFELEAPGDWGTLEKDRYLFNLMYKSHNGPERVIISPVLVRAVFAVCESRARPVVVGFNSWQADGANGSAKEAFLQDLSQLQEPSDPDKVLGFSFSRRTSMKVDWREVETDMPYFVESYKDCVRRQIAFAFLHELAHVYLADRNLNLEDEEAQADCEALRHVREILGEVHLGLFDSVLRAAVDQGIPQLWGVPVGEEAPLQERFKALRNNSCETQ